MCIFKYFRYGKSLNDVYRPGKNMKRRVSPKMYISRFKTQLKNGLEISFNSNKKTTVQDIPIGIL